ncbi:MAG TPA: HAD-IA family hydrolase [Actinospica sp.]|jgi:FMN phosphatase YigB (HAD superfamily)|nr:HAD-IA family hydrolase [Actinospica sp.]
MTTPVVVAADIFGVLVALDTGWWRAEITRISGLTDAEFMKRWRESRLGEAWDTGALTISGFTAKLGDLLEVPGLTEHDVSGLWSNAVGVVDPLLGPMAARLSRERRLILASNNNPVQWPIVEGLLVEAGFAPEIPAVLSHEVGLSKPDPGFYAELIERTAGLDVVFVDDRLSNIEAAVAGGLKTVHHTDSVQTAAILTALLDLGESE